MPALSFKDHHFKPSVSSEVGPETKLKCTAALKLSDWLLPDIIVKPSGHVVLQAQNNVMVRVQLIIPVQSTIVFPQTSRASHGHLTLEKYSTISPRFVQRQTSATITKSDVLRAMSSGKYHTGAGKTCNLESQAVKETLKLICFKCLKSRLSQIYI